MDKTIWNSVIEPSALRTCLPRLKRVRQFPRATVPGSSHLSIKVVLSLGRSDHVWRQTIQKRDSEYLFLAGLFHGMRGLLSSSEESNALQRP